MTVEPAVGGDVLQAIRGPVDAALGSYLERCVADLGEIDASAPMLVDEIARLMLAGGKRLRPAFCIWGYRAARPGGRAPHDGAPGADEPITRAAAALELLHTMALIHDDLMDGAASRRGVPASAAHLAGEARRLALPVDPARFGRAGALLAGDLAAVLADRLFLSSGFDVPTIAAALVPFHEMRLDMAAGQLLDVAGLADEPAAARRAARLKGGSYTVEGPLMVGSTLAGAGDDVRTALRAFGSPLGEAFQLRDDLRDGEGEHGATPDAVNLLVDRARAILAGAVRDATIDPGAAHALDRLAALVSMP